MVEFDLNENKETVRHLMKEFVKRDGVENLMRYIDKSDFFVAPASTRFHLDVPGGLCQHSLNVFNRLIREVECEFKTVEESPYTMETLTLISLMHDLCKVDFYVLSSRNKKSESGEWVKVPYYTIEDNLPISHSFKSQYILRSYVNLSREESIAIMSHMGGFDCTIKGGDFSVSNAFRAYPLAVLLHTADLKASYLDEA